jgi:hypothetical protein
MRNDVVYTPTTSQLGSFKFGPKTRRQRLNAVKFASHKPTFIIALWKETVATDNEIFPQRDDQ